MQYLKSFVIENREPFKPIEARLYSGNDEFGYEFWQDTGFGRMQKVNDCWGFESQDGAEKAARAILCPDFDTWDIHCYTAKMIFRDAGALLCPDFATCPLCGDDLEVDEEYMQNRYGEAYMYESVQWTYFAPAAKRLGPTVNC